MTKQDLQVVMDDLFKECQGLREAGQKEYAHRDENAFANFERLSERMGISREQVLLVYMEKHLDGIHSYTQGHHSQRESVRGRIKDAIVYLCILAGMVEENEKFQSINELEQATVEYVDSVLNNSPFEKGNKK